MTNKTFNADISKHEKRENSNYVEILITDFRNGFERCFFQLSTYERETSYNELTNECTMKLFYNSDYETELLITLMSFGPAIKVLGPERFKRQFVKRLKKQMKFAYS